MKAPRYDLLDGRGTYHYKGYSAKSDNLLPPLLVATPFGMQPGDARLADVSGDGLPDFAIGRLPVVTAGELQAVVAKIRAYEAGGGWRSELLFAADNGGEAGDFAAASDEIARNVVDGYAIEKAYIDNSSAGEVRSSVLSGFSHGKGLVNYVGHAGITALAHEGILKSGDVDGLGNAGNAPVLIAASCDMAQCSVPGYASLGETLVVNRNGAVAVWSALGEAFNTVNKNQAGWIVGSLYRGNGALLGDAVCDGITGAANGAAIALRYVLLGDPTLGVCSSARLRQAIVPSRMTRYEWLRLMFTPIELDDLGVDVNSVIQPFEPKPTIFRFGVNEREIKEPVYDGRVIDLHKAGDEIILRAGENVLNLTGV
jgi:hypothetical protein